MYKLTVFKKNGKKLLEQSFEAITDADAKDQGSKILHMHAYENHTYRCTSSQGKLLLFHE